MAKSSAFVLATFLLLLMVCHFAFAARTMQTNMMHATRTDPTGKNRHAVGTGVTDNKNFVFGGVGSGIGGGVGFVGPFGGVSGFSGVGGGVGGVGFPVGGAVGGAGGLGGVGGGGLGGGVGGVGGGGVGGGLPLP